MTYLSTWKVLGGTCKKDEDFGKSAPFLFYLIMKKVFTLILLSLIAFNAIHAEITWTLSDDGTLTISGTDMPNYDSYSDPYLNYETAPWSYKKDEINKITIENGVKNIGSYAFQGCSNLKSISIPNSVTRIGGDAFYGCSRLSSITIPISVTSI